MDSSSAKILFLVMFGVSVSCSANNVIMEIFPLGVGHLLKDGVKSFITRASFIGITGILWSICLVFSLNFCGTISGTHGFGYDMSTVLLLLLMSASAWLCDHIARILFFPFRNILAFREKEYSSVDILFILIYCTTFSTVFFVRELFK